MTQLVAELSLPSKARYSWSIFWKISPYNLPDRPVVTFVSESMPWAGLHESRSRPKTSTFGEGVRVQIRRQQEVAPAPPPCFAGEQGLRITLIGVRVTSYS